jgi:predicted Fe-Mo cluster-binding NifX family protein
LREGLSLERAHAISEEIERRIKERFSDLESVTVHVGLAHKNTMKIAVPIVENKGLDSLTSQHFGSAPVFAFVDVQKNQVIGFYVKENEGAKLSQKKGMRAANLLIGENIDALIAGGVGEGPFHTLGDSMVLIYRLPTEPVTVQEAIRLLNENLLQKMATSTEKQIEGEI